MKLYNEDCIFEPSSFLLHMIEHKYNRTWKDPLMESDLILIGIMLLIVVLQYGFIAYYYFKNKKKP